MRVAVLDFTTLRVLVCGGGAPQRFARMNLIALRRLQQKPLVPIALYLSLFRALEQNSHLPALTDLASLRQDVELADLTEKLLSDAEQLHRANGTLDILDCLSVATALNARRPLAVMNPRPYRSIGGLQIAEWWKKP
jgi:hypothetical protein